MKNFIEDRHLTAGRWFSNVKLTALGVCFVLAAAGSVFTFRDISKETKIVNEKALETRLTQQELRNSGEILKTEAEERAELERTQSAQEVANEAVRIQSEAALEQTRIKADVQVESARNSLGLASTSCGIDLKGKLTFTPGVKAKDQLDAIGFDWNQIGSDKWTPIKAEDVNGAYIVFAAARVVDGNLEIHQADITGLNESTICNNNRLNENSAI